MKANLDRWYADLKLINSAGTATLKPVKLVARLIQLLKRQNNKKNVFKRLKDELPGLTTPIFHAIIHGSRLPDSVAVRALQNIRSQMLAGGARRQGPYGSRPDFLPVAESLAHPKSEGGFSHAGI